MLNFISDDTAGEYGLSRWCENITDPPGGGGVGGHVGYNGFIEDCEPLGFR